MSEEIRTEEKTEVKNNVKPRKSKGKKALKILAVIICAFILLGLLASLVSAIGNKANLGKAQSFEKVSYDKQLVPEKDEDGNWFFTADRDFKILQITDVHIGGGWMCVDKDSSVIDSATPLALLSSPCSTVKSSFLWISSLFNSIVLPGSEDC